MALLLLGRWVVDAEVVEGGGCGSGAEDGLCYLLVMVVGVFWLGFERW